MGENNMTTTNRISRSAIWTVGALMVTGLAIGLALPSAAEEEMPMGGGGTGMGMHGMGMGADQAPSSTTSQEEMQRRLDDLRHHTMMMDEIQDTEKLLDAMRRHMRMIDEMMAEMLRAQTESGSMKNMPMKHM